MKTKLTVITLLVILALSFLYTSGKNEIAPPLPPAGNNISDSFLIGAIDDGWDLGFKYLKDSLGFNLWHKYCGSETIQGRNYPTGWIHNGAPNDKLFADSSAYVSQVIGVLNSISSNNMKAFMHRPKIEYLCSGQRSDYQCEEGLLNTNLWYYAFNSHECGSDYQDTSVFGNGEKVRYCKRDTNNQGNNGGFVVRRLKANTEQCHKINGDGGYRGDSECDWIIKPRIRVDSMFVRTTNDETPICKVIVLNQKSDTLKATILKAKNFKDDAGNYDGKYKEEYRRFPGETNLTISADTSAWGDDWIFNARGNKANDDSVSKADIQIYWYGNCDMWIDYVRVDNDIADELFKGNRNDWLQWEALNIAGHGDSPLQFYIELFEFNQIPCIAYVNRKLDSIVGKHFNVMADQLTYYQYHMPKANKGEIVTPEKIKTDYIDKTNSFQVFTGNPYPLTSAFPSGCGNGSWDQYSRIPSTLPVTSGPNILAVPIPPANYDYWLQNLFDTVCSWYEVPGNRTDLGEPIQLRGVFSYLMKRGNAVSKLSDKPFIAMLQAHQWVNENEVDREPTTEEQDLMTNLAVSYGAKGILYYWYGSNISYLNPDCEYTFGLMDTSSQLPQPPRYKNIYNQPKWERFKEMVKKLKKWGPTLISFDNVSTKSYIYRFDAERTDLLNNTYFNEVYSYYPQNSLPDAPNLDDVNNRYLQVSTFSKIVSTPYEKYFMITNRRCSPFRQDSNDNGGRRKIKVKFDANSAEFAGFNNWNIINLENDSIILPFNKNVSSPLDLGWILPGEAILCKIAPVMVSGGTLVTNDSVNTSFNCNAMVYNNGKNLTIGQNTSIYFSEGAGITMNGGYFTCGIDADDVNQLSLDGNNWAGIDLNNCEITKIYNTIFQGIKSPPPGRSSYAVKITDCHNPIVKKVNFSSSEDNKFGGLYCVFTQTEGKPSNPVIISNTFYTGVGDSPAIVCIASASNVALLRIEWNIFSSGSDNSTAILVNNISAGSIKNNLITDFKTGITVSSSNIDLYGNQILSSLDNATGIYGVSESELYLATESGYYYGGMDSIVMTGIGSCDLKVDNSIFSLLDGNNTLNINSNNDYDGYHLFGFFPGDTHPPPEIKEYYNCFQINGKNESYVWDSVLWGNGGDKITFIFEPFSCSSNRPENYIVNVIENEINDTINFISGGNGGAVREFKKLIDKKPVISENEKNTNTESLKSIWSDIKSNLRKRNFTMVEQKTKELINTYPDSIQCIGAIEMLYQATKNIDTNNTKIQNLKTYFENLILNNSGKTSLINRAFYFIQKAKVVLEEYQSALQGFQQIMTAFPYSYEGLVASWDYSTTCLLDSLNGSGGGFSSKNVELENKNYFDSSYVREISKGFNNSQKLIITTNLNNAFEEQKNKEGERKKDLETKSENGSKKAARELQKMKVLSEAVKEKKPRNMSELKTFIDKDIKKVFVGETDEQSNIKKKILPTVFELYQNYPNPFNPVTKISYALPQSAKVNIAIYDILGREITKLVNGEFQQPGRYIVEFNGQGYASGIYFYRIIAEGKKEYTMTKKMVLIK